MRVFVTNDDGLEADGLATCIAALQGHSVFVVVPSEQQSAVSAALTLRRPLSYRHVEIAGCEGAYSCDGTPVDAAKLGLRSLVPWPPDLVVSGFNMGINVGQDVLYSGTIASAMEALFWNMPALAVSLKRPFEVSSSTAARFLPSLMRIAVSWSGAGRFLLSVNVPAEENPPIVIARQGVSAFRYWHEHDDSKGRGQCWLKGEPEMRDSLPDTDASVVSHGCAAISIIRNTFDVFPDDARPHIADLSERINREFPVLSASFPKADSSKGNADVR
ncbi:MAG: 5'/3'-nucleotidase SurE [Candidatus Brocadiia bacterium]